MLIRILVCLAIIISLAAMPAAAQEDLPSWCPLEETELSPAEPVRTVYVESGNLYLMDEGSEPLLLVDTGDVNRVNLSDDGAVIAFTRMVDALWVELWAVNSDGSDRRLLVGAEQFAAMRTEDFADAIGLYRFDWIPGTHTLAFNSAVLVAPGSGIYEHIADDLWMVDADTTELTPLLAIGEGGEFAYSPDGSQVVIAQLHRLDVMNADGSNRRTDILDEYDTVGVGHGSIYPAILWEDNDSFLTAVSTSGDPMLQSEGEVTVFRISLDGAEPEAVSSFNAFFPSFEISPDLTRVTFWRTVSEGSNTRQLHIASIDSTEDFIYLEADLLEFSGWMPDSQHFLFRDYFENPVQFGDICGGAEPFGDVALPMVQGLWWVDSHHYVYFVYEGDHLVYYVGTLNGNLRRLDGVTAMDAVTL